MISKDAPGDGTSSEPNISSDGTFSSKAHDPCGQETYREQQRKAKGTDFERDPEEVRTKALPSRSGSQMGHRRGSTKPSQTMMTRSMKKATSATSSLCYETITMKGVNSPQISISSMKTVKQSGFTRRKWR